MKRSSPVSAMDFGSLGLMMGQCAFFITPPMKAQQLLAIVIILVASVLAWGALRRRWILPAAVRTILVAGIVCVMLITKFSPPGRTGIFYGFLVMFLLFSTELTRRGAALRLLCGFVAGVMLFSMAPPIFGFSFSIAIALVFVGSLISSWSEMSLGSSLFWFVKRSIRRETIFVILFLAGIATIGVRQAQNYAIRQSEISGLSHTLSPGGMNSLALSPALAMRVQFKEPLPLAISNVYFRGTVMDRFAGFNWLQGPSRIRKKIENDGSDIKYEVALNSRYAEFAPVLDYGVSIQSIIGNGIVAQGRDNGVFYPLERYETWSYYEGRSRLTPVHELAAEDRLHLLQHPKKIDPLILDLARKLAGETPNVKTFWKNTSAFLSSGGFRYSLVPESATGTLSEFLFKNKAGYCEHFASAVAGLARYGGIPARVVAGFQGGEWDGRAQTLYVRDLDAHAWTELWDDTISQWVRFDPVEFVAPERLTNGSASFLRSIGAAIPDEFELREKIWISNLLMELDYLIAIVNTNVTNSMAESIVDYGEEMAIIGLIGLTTSFLLIRVRRYNVRKGTLEVRLVHKLARLLTRFNLNRNPGETTFSWLSRSATELNVVSEELRDFANAHARFCYGRETAKEDLLQMKVSLRKLKLKLKDHR